MKLNNILKHTKDILEKNLRLKEKILEKNKIILIYDIDSTLSTLIWEAYAKNLIEYKNTEILIFNENNTDKEKLKTKLLNLKENDTVILVQSTNFRLDDFRIRIHLQRLKVGCIEHNHLKYIKKEECQNYINALTCDIKRYTRIWEYLENKLNTSDELKIYSWEWNILKITWWFEKVRLNIWKFELDKRYWTLPIWEIFTESKIFDNVNWELSIYAFPDSNFQMIFPDKSFIVKIKNSRLICDDKNMHPEFQEILDKIKLSENNEVFVRELWFWLNSNISRDKTLSDVNSYERVLWFHMSLGKSHNIYRKKFNKKVWQRYHIDIFPDITKIVLWDTIIFKDWDYIVEWNWFRNNK